MGDTSDLIAALSRDLVPVRRIPALRAGGAAVALAGAAAAGLWLALGPGLRDDVASLGVAPGYAAVLAGLLLIGAGGTLSALAGSVPGRDTPARTGTLAALVGLGLAVGLGALLSPWGPGAGGAAALIRCQTTALALALPPAAACAWFLRRGMPGRPLAVAAAAVAGAAALGAAATHLACPLSHGGHVIPGHAAVPLVWLALLSLPAARALRAAR